MPKLCWCGRDHTTIAQADDARNGPLKHSVLNWKLYELRMVDMGLDPFPENGKRNGHKPKDVSAETLDELTGTGDRPGLELGAGLPDSPLSA